MWRNGRYIEDTSYEEQEEFKRFYNHLLVLRYGSYICENIGLIFHAPYFFAITMKNFNMNRMFGYREAEKQ